MTRTLPVVACLGEALVDRLGPLGGDPLTDKPVIDCFGGAPANVACGLAKLGTNVAFIGRLGSDVISDKFRNLMKIRGVNIIGLQTDFKRPCRIVLVRRSNSGERTFNGFEGDQGDGFADQALDKNQLKETFQILFKKVSWLLIGSIPLASPISREALHWIVDMAIKQGINIVFDVNWRPTFWNPNMDPTTGPNLLSINEITYLFECASLLKLAREEALWFFENDDPKKISLSLSKKPDVVITDGAKPINWFLGGNSGQTATIVPKVVQDTTGAGDAFMAGFLHKLALDSYSENKTIDFHEVVSFAAACGAITCSGSGAIDPQPTQAEVEKFLNFI